MPLYFWNDPDGSRYRESYFGVYPGVWRHGDWMELTPRKTAIISGRSDATLKRSGVRMGTSEFYATVEALPAVADSLIVDTGSPEGLGDLVMFVVLARGTVWDEGIAETVKAVVRRELSPRHVPDKVIPIAEVPRTHTGKKLEVPVKRLLQGAPLQDVVNMSSVSNPAAIEFFVGFDVSKWQDGASRPPPGRAGS
jgi:acetoacetyl-CoA synthetase